MRTSGILLAISSLNSKYGVGDFGKEAYTFVDIIQKTGFTSLFHNIITFLFSLKSSCQK